LISNVPEIAAKPSDQIRSPGNLMMTGRRASRRYRLATESNAVDGVGALKVTTQEAVGSIKMISSTIGKISEITHRDIGGDRATGRRHPGNFRQHPAYC